MSSTTHDIVFELNVPQRREPGVVWELVSMAGDAFRFGPAPSTAIERVEAATYGVLFASALLMASYLLSFAW